MLTDIVITVKNVFILGSYDHTVRLFDTRCKTSVLRIDHGSPVESVVMFPGGGIVASAGRQLCRCILFYSLLCLVHFHPPHSLMCD